MIIEPDFLDHWKTRLLMRLLDTDAAPNYVIRLWSHCQTRKTNIFPEWSPVILSSVCRWPGDADVFWSAMLQTFCRIEDGHLVAHQWDEVNAGLICSWSNGAKGGRPKKPTGNPRVNPEPIPVNPQLTHGVTDREDREEKTEKKKQSVPLKSEWEIAHGVELPELIRTKNCLDAIRLWIQYKAEKRETYKKTGLTAALTKWSREFTPAELPSVVENSIASGWKGLYKSQAITTSSTPGSPKKELDWRDSL
jgi:hypothetical protein